MAKQCQNVLTFAQIQNELSKHNPKLANFTQEWRNFAKSGHTA